MQVMIVIIVVSAAVAALTSYLTIRFSKPTSGTLLSHHPYRRHCQDVDTVEECDGGDPISTKEMGPSKFMGI